MSPDLTHQPSSNSLKEQGEIATRQDVVSGSAQPDTVADEADPKTAADGADPENAGSEKSEDDHAANEDASHSSEGSDFQDDGQFCRISQSFVLKINTLVRHLL